jgi:hypothetical protein
MFYHLKYLIYCIVILLILTTPSVLYGNRSNYADQQFLDNATQFNEAQGVRNENFQGSSAISPQQIYYYAPAYSGIEVVTKKETQDADYKPKPKRGLSFSDMSKKIQKRKTQLPKYSFRNMARFTKKRTVSTSNLKLKKRSKMARKAARKTTQSD